MINRKIVKYKNVHFLVEYDFDNKVCEIIDIESGITVYAGELAEGNSLIECVSESVINGYEYHRETIKGKTNLETDIYNYIKWDGNVKEKIWFSC